MTEAAAANAGERGRPRRPRSLLARALALLARREHSRAELARKLGPHAATADELAVLLDNLQARRLLSDERFVEVLARSRSQRFGAARIRQELRARGVSDELTRAAVADLHGSELQRARDLWLRRYGQPAALPAERARQMRFLAARGFSSDVIRKVVGGEAD
jgi:regulatory protein